MIRLIAGLGNPGEKYQGTRHSVGFAVVDALAARYDARWDQWKGHWAARMVTDMEEATLFKAEDFMNISGVALAAHVNFYKLPTDQLLVVHDELDLPFGRLQLKFGGSAGGHNGVQSVIDQLGSDVFWRLRVGIGRPNQQMANSESQMPDQDQISTYVLSQFAPTERENLAAIIDESVALLVESVTREPQAVSKTIQQL